MDDNKGMKNGFLGGLCSQTPQKSKNTLDLDPGWFGSYNPKTANFGMCVQKLVNFGSYNKKLTE
jgi:hypothetical protein